MCACRPHTFSYVHVYMHVHTACMHVCSCMYTVCAVCVHRAGMFACMCTCVHHASIFVYACACMCACVHVACVHMCMHECAHSACIMCASCKHVHVCMCSTSACVYMHVCACMYTRMYTRMHKVLPQAALLSRSNEEMFPRPVWFPAHLARQVLGGCVWTPEPDHICNKEAPPESHSRLENA